MHLIPLQQLNDVRLCGDVAARDSRDGIARAKGEEVVTRLLRCARDFKRRERGGDAAPDA
jgi:hypothetical protein